MEGLKATISDLSAYRMLVEMCGDLISVHAADDKVRRPPTQFSST